MSMVPPVQRLALVDAAAWWLSEPNGDELAYALLAASCSEAVTTEHAYLVLITPSDEPGDDGEGPSFVVPDYGPSRAPSPDPECVGLSVRRKLSPLRRCVINRRSYGHRISSRG